MLHRFLPACLAALCLCLPANAQSSLEDIVRLGILHGSSTSAGKQKAAVHVSLSEGWHTYWRVPGDAGIPPEFDWRGSRNIGSVSVYWPTPRVLHKDGIRSIVYYDTMVLPLSVEPKDPGKPIRLKGTISLGVCENTCIPASFRVDTTLEGTGQHQPVIAAAMATRPHTAQEGRVTAARCEVTTDAAHGLRLSAHITMPSAGGPEEVVIEPGDARIWASVPRTRRNGATLSATSTLVHSQAQGGFAIDLSQMRITVLGANYAVDIQGCTGG